MPDFEIKSGPGKLGRRLRYRFSSFTGQEEVESADSRKEAGAVECLKLFKVNFKFSEPSAFWKEISSIFSVCSKEVDLQISPIRRHPW